MRDGVDAPLPETSPAGSHLQALVELRSWTPTEKDGGDRATYHVVAGGAGFFFVRAEKWYRPVHVRLTVYDVLGRRVAILIDQPYAPGRHEVAFDAARMPSGLYL